MDGGSNLVERYAVVTPTNQGAVLNIIDWLLMVYMILAVLIRLAIKALTVSERYHWDDLIVVLAMIFNIVQVVMMSVGVGAGLGQMNVNGADINTRLLLKVSYTSHILYFIVLFLTKIAALHLIYRLGWVYRSNRIACVIAGVFIGIWAVVGVFTQSFECGSTPPWDSTVSDCIDGVAFMEAMDGMNIVTEFAVIGLPVWLMWHLPMPPARKIVAALAFAVRIIVVGAIIARMILLPEERGSDTRTYSAVSSTIATQCVLSFAIMTACTPVLRPFLDAFDSGMLGVNLRRQGRYSDAEEPEMEGAAVLDGLTVSSRSDDSRRALRPAPLATGAAVNGQLADVGGLLGDPPSLGERRKSSSVSPLDSTHPRTPYRRNSSGDDEGVGEMDFATALRLGPNG